MIGMQVENMRKGPFGNVLAFFDLAIGEELDGDFQGSFLIRGFALKKKRDGGYWFQGPSKLRTNKAGEPVVGADGYKVYDPYFDLYFAGSGSARQPTEASWDARKKLIELATAAYELAGSVNRGRGVATAASRPDNAAERIDAPEGEALFDGEDDDLPF